MAGGFTDELVLVEPRGTISLVRPRRWLRDWSRRPWVVGRSSSRKVPRAPTCSSGRALTVAFSPLADVLVATVVLLLITHLSEAADFSSAMLVTLPLIVVVNKVWALYERDELVLKKSTLDEVPMLLQIAGLFALIVWLFTTASVRPLFEARDVMLIWASTFGGLVLGRSLARTAAGRASSIERCLVVGDEDAIDTVARKLTGSRVKAAVIADLPFEGGPLDLRRRPLSEAHPRAPHRARDHRPRHNRRGRHARADSHRQVASASA